MDDRVTKWLLDAYLSCQDIKRFTGGVDETAYEQDLKLRLAVERSFEIIGEALKRVRDHDETILTQVTDYQDIIGFRNHLAHGYDHVDNLIVWEIMESQLDLLIQDLLSYPEVRNEVEYHQ